MVMTDHIADAFFAETLRASITLRRRYNIRQFDADAILLREIQCKKSNISMFKRRFQCGFTFPYFDRVKYARSYNDHICLFHCINTNDLVFKQIPRDQETVNA